MLKRLQIKTRRIWGAAAVAIALELAGCSAGDTNTNNSTPIDTNQSQTTPASTQAQTSQPKPKVVVTTGVLCDLTTKIAQDTIDMTCLIKPGQDPHTYQAQPEDRKAIETANLIFYGGYNHEPTLLKLIQSTTNAAPKIAIHEKAVPKPLMGDEHEHEHEEESHTQEKTETSDPNHKEGELVADPHVWHNAKNGIGIVAVISGELEKLAPSNAELYSRNAKKLTGELEQLDSWIKAQIATIPSDRRKLITTHDALSYYANAYGLEITGALQGVSTEEQPTPKRIAELSEEIKSTGVPTIFAETTVNPKLIETVAREANVKISAQELYSDGLGSPGSGADTYEGMLAENTCAIAQGLGGKCTPLTAQTPK
ncbi:MULTISPECIES: metal ABC transporter solute-binding protein, Zn/Mn family [Kamptonema]|uniref:metal ABC transporter solute-binding protein, Zn/Mn family n=1 Tax=Kamptonema TaxID=1501433 RepID=UPI0001DAC1C1|nr:MULTISPECIES: zinc ABC transporter substrate-binding protein [Kamptonema]CBN58958.1 Mn transporter MntC [Kamptonema sp. PCC 6506]